MGKDQLFFPIKEVAPRTLRPHTVFCVRAFLCALASEASLGTLIPKRSLAWAILDCLSKRSRDSFE